MNLCVLGNFLREADSYVLCNSCCAECWKAETFDTIRYTNVFTIGQLQNVSAILKQSFTCHSQSERQQDRVSVFPDVAYCAAPTATWFLSVLQRSSAEARLITSKRSAPLSKELRQKYNVHHPQLSMPLTLSFRTLSFQETLEGSFSAVRKNESLLSFF